MDNLIENKIVKLLIEKKIKITTMESCTSGLVISTITNVEGASSITDGGDVTYSNKQKIRQGVSADVINKYGVYSSETAFEMAKTCMKKNDADIGIGVTGTLSNIDNNNADSKTGEVYYCIVYKDKILQEKLFISNDLKVDENENERYFQKKYIVNSILKNLELLLLSC